MNQRLGGIIFIVLLLVALAIYMYYPVAVALPATKPVKEAFLDVGIALDAADQTAELPIADYKQTAKTAPTMWTDGSRESAGTKRVKAALEDLRAFLTYEAAQLDETSDPAIQVPLLTAKGDLKALESEAIFLERNPGLKTTISLKQIQGIEENLSGLRRRARSLDGGRDAVEGFESGSDAAASAGRADCPPATLEQVKGLEGRILGEMTRLSANATADPVMAARINNLSKIREGVKTIIAQVESGDLVAAEIPIYTCDIDKFLVALGKDEPTGIAAVAQQVGMANLFPGTATRGETDSLLEKYGEKLLNGLSGGIYLRYVSPNEVSVSAAAGAPISGSAAEAAIPATPGTPGIYMSGADTLVSSLTGTSTATSKSTNTSIAGASPARFDWRTRTKEICAAVKRRGLDPADFGCLAPAAEVSDAFDWRGHAKMVCSRLGTSYDTGLPELVGCPAFSFAGWTSRQ
jgi:hypothetical protein